MKNRILPLILFVISIAATTAIAQPCSNVVLDCSGSSDRILVTPFTSPADFTIMAWFKSFSTPNGAAEDRIISFSEPRLEIGLENGSQEGKLWVFDSEGGGTMNWGSDLHDDTWHHVALTRAGTNREIFLDGVSVATWTGDATVLYGTFLRIGDWHVGNSIADWFGQLDDIRIYDTAMTLAEVQTNMSCMPDGTEPNLVALWNFEDGAPAGNNTALTMVSDVTGNGNDGVLENYTLTGNTSNFVCADSTFLMVICGCTDPPVASCAAGMTIDMGADGTIPIAISDIDNGSVANCGISSLALSHNVLTCADGEFTSITLTVTDLNGISDSCMTTIQVFDVHGYCCPQLLGVNIHNTDIPDGTYTAEISVVGDDLVPAGGDVIFHAGTSICLDPGFEVDLSAEFYAYIEGCCSSATISPTVKNVISLPASGVATLNMSNFNISVSSTCAPSSYTLSFSDVVPNQTVLVIDCSFAPPAVPGGMNNPPIYLWSGGSVIATTNAFLVVSDPMNVCCMGDPPPIITGPADSTFYISSSATVCEQFASLPAMATDNTPGVVVTNDSPFAISNMSGDASGTYPGGTTPVTITATDACGGTTFHSYNVTVTDTTATIASCKKIIETIQPANPPTFPLPFGIVDVNQACVSLTSLCSTNAFSLSFDPNNINTTTIVVGCAEAANPGGIVPGGYTIYLWAGNTVIDSCNNFLQVVDAAGHCI